MKIQPGIGHIFDSSSKGMSIDVSEQFPARDSEAVCPLQIYGLYYDSTDDAYYIYVSPGAVNNVAVKGGTPASILSSTPPPKINVFTAGLTASVSTNYIYIVCENSGTPDYNYPNPSVPPYISVETTEQSDSDTKGYLLIGIIEGSTDATTDVDTLNTYNYKGCGSLWSERFKCGSSTVSYWWSAV